MKLQTDNYRLGETLDTMRKALLQLLPRFAQQINATSESRITGAYNALEEPPTSGLYMHGDFIRNNAPTVLGDAGQQYIIMGWMCVSSGEPGEWFQCRVSTGT